MSFLELVWKSWLSINKQRDPTYEQAAANGYDQKLESSNSLINFSDYIYSHE